FTTLPDEGVDNLQLPDESFDALTDDALDISIPEGDFATPQAADDDLDSGLTMPADEADDFTALPDEGVDSLELPDESLDALTDDSLDMPMPEDDLAALPDADDIADSLPPAQDDFIAQTEDGLDDNAAMPDDGLIMEMLTDNNLDMPMVEDDFAALSETDDIADSLSMPEDDFTALPEADDIADSLSIPEDNFAAMPEADDVADSLSMPEDDFAAMPETDEGMDSGLSMKQDSFEKLIPEDLEAEIEESPVPFDDDLNDDLAVEEMSSLLDTAAKDKPEKRTKPSNVRVISSAPEAGDKKKGQKSELDIPVTLKNELKTVLSYMDRLLDSLPEEKIAEFAKSEYFDSYKKLFMELGLV
ncbi:MAG: hypothetical protein LBU82_02575, partial [Treponema sp.]|nr:hypothetical protein [Treponema sp.]